MVTQGISFTFASMKLRNEFIALKKAGKKGLALLIDPDKVAIPDELDHIIALANASHVDFFFVGGSLMTQTKFEECVARIKDHSQIPVVLFPGDPSQLSPRADALLFLSLVSGRNAELLIGKHVIAAPRIKAYKLETIATAYMLIDCGKPTTASYISNSLPIPYDKGEIAATTALAAEMLGMQCLYLDGGSGAEKHISTDMISRVHKTSSLPLIVGGGIRSAAELQSLYLAGADVCVVGTAIERNPDLLFDLAACRQHA